MFQGRLDGQKITANGNEVARLDFLLRKGHSNR
ncbi:CopK family periplasmic copper-binding protein [Tepidimonas taiwanensis]|nr:CopK family periplasmic copper-binding protein [Tepidimonas taiwanensis]